MHLVEKQSWRQSSHVANNCKADSPCALESSAVTLRIQAVEHQIALDSPISVLRVR